jgi:hypothetical protein
MSEITAIEEVLRRFTLPVVELLTDEIKRLGDALKAEQDKCAQLEKDKAAEASYLEYCAFDATSRLEAIKHRYRGLKDSPKDSKLNTRLCADLSYLIDLIDRAASCLNFAFSYIPRDAMCGMGYGTCKLRNLIAGWLEEVTNEKKIE